MHVVRSLHHIDGKQIGASADGRRAGEPVADSVGAPGGISPAGPTAMLRSVMKLDPSSYYPGGYNLNLTLPSSSADPQSLVGLADAFFANGGQELQIASLDPDLLRDARSHPERHPTLLVRIAGFCALFATLSPLEQEEMIARAESARR